MNPNHPQQCLFSETESPVEEAENARENTDVVVSIAAHKCKKKKSNQTAPRRIVTIPVDNKTCPCGCKKSVIRYEICEMYHYQQGVHEIIEERREVVGCPKGYDQSTEAAKKRGTLPNKI